MHLRSYRRVTQGRKRDLSDLVTEMLQDPAVRAEYEALEWRGNRLVRASMPKEPGLPSRRPHDAD
jgi:hypothetical protein